jgi:tetratricopeptide (TPR) repeat protein/O-antigen ligase
MANLAAESVVPGVAGVLRWGLILLLGFATLTFGGTPSWAGAILILFTFALVALWLIQSICSGQFEFRPTPLDLPLVLFLGLILVQLFIGYPIRLNQPDLGRQLLSAVQANPGELPFIPGSVDYHATRWSLLFFLAYVACFYLVVHTLDRREHVTQFLLFIVGMAGVGGVYGLLEYLSGNQGVLGLKPEGGGRVRGTFINPDHFGAFLAMALMAGIGMLIALGTRRIRRSGRREDSRPEDGDEGRVLEPSASRSGEQQEQLFQNVLLLFVLGLVGTALVFTMSRGAIVSAFVAGGAVAGMLGLHARLGRRRLLGAAVLLLVSAFVLWIGLGPLLDRFGQVAVGWSDRLIIYHQALRIVRDFPLLGTGFGTFGAVFPRYQAPPLGLDLRFSHAHSDFLQLATEGGVATLAILGLGLWALVREVAAVRILGIAKPVPAWPWRRALVVSGIATVTVLALTGTLSSGLLVRSGVAVVIFGALSLVLSSSPQDSDETLQTGPGQEPSSRVANNRGISPSGRRRDPFNIGVALGSLGALVAILIHSLGDFSLRIPANALLLSALLGVSLQAARVRFRDHGPEHLSPVVVVPLRGRRRVLFALGGAVILGWCSWTALSSALAESRILRAADMVEGIGLTEQWRPDRPWVAWTRRSAAALSLVRGGVWLDPTNPRGHLGLGRLYEVLALRAWNTGVSAEGRLLPDVAQRAEETRRSLSTALTSFSRAAYLAPMDRRAWGQLGWTHGTMAWAAADEQGEAAERQASLAAFHRGMALRPNDPYPFQLQADYAFQWVQGQRGRMSSEYLLGTETYQAGLKATRHLVELQPTYLPEALNRVLLSTRDFGTIQGVIPPHAPDFLFAARLLYDQGLYEISRLALERAVALAPDEDRPIFSQYLAEDSIRRGEVSRAVQLLEFVLGLDPQNLDARLMLADAMAKEKLGDRALREYQSAVETAKRLASSAASRPAPGGLPSEPLPRTRMEIVEEALRERDLLVAGSERDPLVKALTALAVFHERRGESDLAIPLWERAIARDPRDARSRFGYGESLDSIGAWIPAQTEYRRALELDAKDIGLRFRLADKYAQNGPFERAMDLWREITRLRPANVEARVRLAGAYEKLGRRKEAELEYDQVLRLEPNNEVARRALTRLRGRAPVTGTSPS